MGVRRKSPDARKILKKIFERFHAKIVKIQTLFQKCEEVFCTDLVKILWEYGVQGAKRPPPPTLANFYDLSLNYLLAISIFPTKRAGKDSGPKLINAILGE